jgi:hypothetical protein
MIALSLAVLMTTACENGAQTEKKAATKPGVLITTKEFDCHENELCAPKPSSGIYVALRDANSFRLIGKFRSGSGGRVLVHLKPGVYWLTPVRGSGRQIESTRINVKSGGLKHVTLVARGPV